jgi:cytochrome c biogenesis protein CcmG/thiol:disulfide interchange protein DsbE
MNIFSKRIFVTLAAIVSLSVLPAIGAMSADSHAAPSFDIANIQGGRISLDDYKGRVVYVDFWASWCGPCRKSFPFMQEIQAEYADAGLTVIAINMDQNPDDAHRFLEEHPAAFLIGRDPAGAVAKQFGVMAMPSSFIVDRGGLIQEVHMGFKPSTRKKITSKIGELL